jgi:NTP pyrophosphatase (non-canonical NTP hydrolase)
MELDAIKQAISKENERLRTGFSLHDDERHILAMTVKLSEEVGEVSEAVLAKTNMQRRDKLVKFSEDSLPDELADVIIVAMLIGDALGIDMEKAIEKKIGIIQKRDIN